MPAASELDSEVLWWCGGVVGAIVYCAPWLKYLVA